MASRLLLLSAALLLVCLAQVSSDVEVENDGVTLVVRGTNRRLLTETEIDCGGLCKVRCGQNSRPKLCIRACGTCCDRCKCVPPGTSGNRELCGTCYADMTTHGNKTKCP